MTNKNEAMIMFLLNCPTILENPLFFNFAEEADGNNHFITEKDSVKRTYVDGSQLKHYTFTIASYSYISHIAIANGEEAIVDENMENMAKVQEILDWINEQSEKCNFPDFGSDCVVDHMTTLTSDPDVDGIDTSVNPPLARYSIGVQIEYLDNSKKLWN